MPTYSHDFIEDYKELIAFGMGRKTDEEAVRAYLQMFSDDQCMAAILPRMSQQQLTQVFDLVSDLLRAHFNEDEYHNFFLKEEHHH